MKNRNVPEIRFQGFTEQWEEKKLIETAQVIYSGGTPKTNIPEFWNGDIPWIQSSDLKLDKLFDVQPKRFITKSAIESSAAKQVPENSIAIVTRVGVGKLVHLPYIYATSQDFISLSHLKIDTGFALYAIYDQLINESKNTQGTSIKGITKKDLLNKKIHVPLNKEEQKKIAALLKAIDDKISFHEQELNNIKQLKQGFLEKIFPKKGESAPQLRFPPFTENWQDRKLGDIVKRIETGKSSFIIKEQSADAPYEILGSTSIIGYDHSYDYDGKFLLTARVGANAGKLYCHSGKVKISDNTVFIQTDNLDFIYNLLSYMDLQKLSFGTGQPLIKASELKKLTVSVPSDKEQIVIGNFFNYLDKTIRLREHELFLLAETKKAFLQKMLI